MLTKGFDSAIKDIDSKKGIVTGYLAHFGTLDSDKDIIVKGAFAKTIQERGPQGSRLIKYLLDHKKDKALGVFTSLQEDNTGLLYEAKIGTHNAGQDFLKMLESDLINQHSIGYNTIKQQAKSDGNHMTELRLLEGSALQFLGANPNTPIVGVKEWKDQLESLEKALLLGTLTDETYIEIEQKIKSLYGMLKPDKSTLNDDEPMIEIIKSFTNSLNIK